MSRWGWIFYGMLGGFIVGVTCDLIEYAMRPEPPAVVERQPEVVRVLDVVLKDSNVTGRRQRFVCNPVKRHEDE